ncbi:antitoxin [Dermacoccus nishinomiyaensis]|nr:antitoxin [Dermacoccus nishinomiyaensis]STD15960.1 Antitoxin MazE9 [Dermacoccus nishinomiyaensis]
MSFALGHRDTRGALGAAEHGLASRSAAVQRAVRNLKHPDLERDYEAAWAEWADSGNDAAQETVTGDGLNDATR